MRVMRFAVAGRMGACGVSTENLDVEVCATPVSWRSGPRARRYGISKYLRVGKWRENGENAQN